VLASFPIVRRDGMDRGEYLLCPFHPLSQWGTLLKGTERRGLKGKIGGKDGKGERKGRRADMRK